MNRLSKIIAVGTGSTLLVTGLWFVIRQAEENRPYLTKEELEAIELEESAPKTDDPILQRALDDPDGFQMQLSGNDRPPQEPESGDQVGVLPSEDFIVATTSNERRSINNAEPLSPEASAARAERMNNALREFAFLRSSDYRDPDSELNRETLNKLEDMRRKRLANRNQDLQENPSAN